MLAFPTLTTGDWHPDDLIEQAAFDPTIRTKSEGGYIKTRPRTTRIPRQWKGALQLLSHTDKAALQVFEESVKIGADAFTWTDPDTGDSRVVRFAGPVQYTPVGSKVWWKASFVLEEV